jgi:hypothetical protein
MKSSARSRILLLYHGLTPAPHRHFRVFLAQEVEMTGDLDEANARYLHGVDPGPR